jgi:hypothetical protein
MTEKIELTENLRRRRQIVGLLGAVQVTKRAVPIDDCDTRQLKYVGMRHQRALETRVADALKREGRVLEKGLGGHAPPTSPGKGERFVDILSRVAVARKFRADLATDFRRLATGALADGENPDTPCFKLGPAALHLAEVLTTDGSTEVAQKDQNRRRAAAQRRQSDLAIVLSEENRIGNAIPYAKCHASEYSGAPTPGTGSESFSEQAAGTGAAARPAPWIPVSV